MAVQVPFRLRLTGDTADQHQFQGYDGYMALAGFAWALSLISNYADTRLIRQRGDFDGRHAVRAMAPSEGSVVVDFLVYIQNNPQSVFGISAASLSASAFLYALVNRVINRNLGETNSDTDQTLAQLLASRGGDIEALVAISESPIRQAHGLIGNGAKKIEISGGFNILNTFDEKTRDYVKLNIEDDNRIARAVSVSAFNANSGYGSVFDNTLGHVIPISMSRETLRKYKSVFSWGLDQYVQGTGRKIDITFTRILAMDERPKRYIIINAARDSEPMN